jgi:tripartite-type tricarboxylate transporter receptor subunit TctC
MARPCSESDPTCSSYLPCGMRTFVIETRPGAGTMIGTEAAARAPADGNTLLINAPFLLIGPHLRKLGFDALTSLEPI